MWRFLTCQNRYRLDFLFGKYKLKLIVCQRKRNHKIWGYLLKYGVQDRQKDTNEGGNAIVIVDEMGS